MVILTQPAALSLSGNIEKIRISTSEDISFVLSKGNKEILSAVYTPGVDHQISIDIRDIVESQLSFTLKDQKTAYVQTSIFADFIAKVNDQTINFRVIRSGVDRLAATAVNFVTANFLTWQPQIKRVTYYTPEFLTYYATVACNLKVKAYFTDKEGKVTTEEKLMCSILAGNAYTIPVQYAVICELYNSKLPSFYDVWVENTSSNRLTYIQRYVADSLITEEEQWILFENSLGGIDTFRAYGQSEFTGNHTHNIAEIDDISQEYRVDTERTFQKSTGYLDKNQRKWLLDFFPAQVKYIYLGNYLRSIVVTEDDTAYTDKELPSEYKFTYKYADARPYLNLPRAAQLPNELNIYVPSLGSFTIPPRLVEFPSQPLSEGVLVPVQNPYSEKWATITAGSIVAYILKNISEDYNGQGGIGHIHSNLELLNAISYLDGYLLVNGKKIKAGWADQLSEDSPVYEMFLRRDKRDTAKELITFLKGTEFGEFIDSMIAGKGAGIYPDGRGQFERLEVRGSAVFKEVIYNRLNAQEGDTSYSENGVIESVTLESDGTYTLKLRKRWENDFTAFQEGDVVYGITNNLFSTGEYYTSWMRVLSKNIPANSISVLSYPDSEVPGGKNYPPTELTIITRRGNAINENRQSYWYLSATTDKCLVWLEGVTKPVLEQNNYYMILGRLPNLDLFDNLPINYKHSYIFARAGIFGELYRVDWQGLPIQELVDRGFWSAEVASSDNPYTNTQERADTVWHYGCKWKCLITGTADEPKYAAAGWAMLEGNPEFTIEIGSTKGWYFDIDTFETTLYVTGYLYNRDVTEHILDADVGWTRDTGNVSEDNAWAVKRAGAGKHLPLTVDDLGPNYTNMRVCTFKATALLRDGQQFEVAENFVTF